MSTKPVRSNCLIAELTNWELTGKEDNGAYDLVDRSDESLNMSSETSDQSINFTALTPCPGYNGEGRRCGAECVDNYLWCNNQWGDSVRKSCGDSGVTMIDLELC